MLVPHHTETLQDLIAEGAYTWSMPRLEDCWDAWTAAAAEVADAMAHWSAAELPSERRDAFASYRAALSREEQAATALAARVALGPEER